MLLKHPFSVSQAGFGLKEDQNGDRIPRQVRFGKYRRPYRKKPRQAISKSSIF
jgi:hypothetical protein